MQKLTARDMAQIAVVAAVYVVLTVTPPFNVISFGAVQFRIAEMLNFTAFYNKKYIIGVTLGCVIANFFSPMLIDVLVGGGSTLVFLTLGVVLFGKFKDRFILGGLMRLDHFYFSLFFSLSMVTIAAELHFLMGAPFFFTWLTTAAGELASLLIGALLINRLAAYIDLTQ
ncbi:QueT transporter family protein [Streptococcus panodentis]|uniref:Queuosine transporter QueT n=1 Tax=Streptococcus panodentis TaxID=1581472 RepID=A0ABS5AYY7_9STRE|nr:MULTISPECIES: QueT transporter family protein [Streptococcus]KXT84010.1 Substrate-specific component QueT of putative queuosine-regulated ECF transporter [Streptococcus sp. DD11]MBP2621790.1 queuosine transporter QueT [Streptococcus panodentis]